MRSVAWLILIMLLVCGLLGFSLAQTDLANPTTSAAQAQIAIQQADVAYEVQLATVRLNEQRMAAEIEAQLSRDKMLANALFALTAVATGCILAITSAAVYLILRRANRPPPAGRLPGETGENAAHRPALGSTISRSSHQNNGSRATHRKQDSQFWEQMP